MCAGRADVEHATGDAISLRPRPDSPRGVRPMRSSHSFSLWLVRALGVFALMLAYSLFIGPYGFRGLHDQQASVAERSSRVFERVRVNQGLEQRLGALQNDPRALEAELRSSQNWVRPGEVMIVLPSEAAPTTPR